ncbi:dynactin subunit 3 [Emys orbicularis]|uniref:dynactin subunit 3 n=1 Tax=Emys orbicularis TaxID=82168 RepID=UPI0031FC3E05
MAVPDAMKLQFILAEEQFILSQVALLDQVNNLQPFLDSAHIKAAPDHAAKLQRLAQIHIQQQAVTEFITSNKSKVPPLSQSKCQTYELGRTEGYCWRPSFFSFANLPATVSQ